MNFVNAYAFYCSSWKSVCTYKRFIKAGIEVSTWTPSIDQRMKPPLKMSHQTFRRKQTIIRHKNRRNFQLRWFLASWNIFSPLRSTQNDQVDRLPHHTLRVVSNLLWGVPLGPWRTLSYPRSSSAAFCDLRVTRHQKSLPYPRLDELERDGEYLKEP